MFLVLVSLALLCMSSSVELHAEYEAVHTTVLWRRSRPTKHKEKKVHVAIGAHALNLMNITTQLEDQKTEYIGTIGVGTNHEGKAQFQARVVFDTGSTNLWVASVLCTEFPCDADRSREFYDPTKSSSQEEYPGVQGDIDIMFGTGELRGPLHVDTYRVGPMVVKSQPFAMIREMNGEVFASFPFEGILGLGFPSLSFRGITPFFERVIQQRLLTNNEFAFFFNVDTSQPSALLWGGIDKNLYHGPIRMFPVAQAHYWALELVDLRMGNVSLTPTNSHGHSIKRLIVDSGTTYFTAPAFLHNRIVKRIPEAPCKQVTEYEPIAYVLRGSDGKTYELSVSQETYMIAGESDRCRPAFMTLDVNKKYGPAMILGEVFMRHFFTVFSRGTGAVEEAKIGFAPAKIGALPKVAGGPGKDMPAETGDVQFLRESEAEEKEAFPLMRRERAPDPSAGPASSPVSWVQQKV